MNRILLTVTALNVAIVLHSANPAAAQQGAATSSKNLDAFYKSLPDVKHLDVARDEALKSAIADAAKRFYTTDTNCKTMEEPGPADFVSPCMSEAAIMGRLLDRAAFVAWYDKFMPAMDSPEFKPLRESIDPAMITSPARLAAKSHMIGLAFMRAEEMNRVAAALPASDPRAQALRKLSAINAAQGMSAMHVAGYLGSHFLGAFSMLYLVSVAP